MSNSDLGALLELDTLTFIRTMGIFLVLGIALYNFTDCGKIFSLISLSIALVLTITVTVNYFLERSKLPKLGFYPRVLVDIIMFVMIFVIFFIAWIIYVVAHSQPISFTEIAKEIEDKMVTNLQSIDKHIEILDNIKLRKSINKINQERNKVNLASLAIVV